MLFNFNLCPLDEISPWGPPDAPSLHWFGLTLGDYWIEAGGSTILEYSDAASAEFGGGRHCRYQVARLHEDLLSILGAAMAPVPEDLRACFSAASGIDQGDGASAFARQLARLRGPDGPDDERIWDLVADATEWARQRVFDCAYLADGPLIGMWSDDAMVHLEWNAGDAGDVWSAGSGAFEMPRRDFAREAQDFHERLMSAMAERIEDVGRGALAPAITVDRGELLRQQVSRAGRLDAALNASQPTDWDRVRRAIRAIEAMKL